MFLKVLDIVNLMEELAPTNLKESYDNVGLMVGSSTDEVDSILIALDCTNSVVDEAAYKGCNLIITHHPLLFFKPGSITDETLQGRKIAKLIKSGINLYSSHTNLDAAKGGLSDLFCTVMGFDNFEIIELKGESEGYGRLVELEEPLPLSKLCLMVKERLDIPMLKFSGDEDKIIKKIALLNGSGDDFFKLSRDKGADCFITGDTKYHYVSDYVEEGISVIDAGHFNTEWPPMKLMAKLIEERLKEKGFNNKVLISECCKDPYKFI